MALSSTLWLLVGAALIGLATRIAVPPAMWIGLTTLVHFSRSVRPGPGMALVWFALLVSLAVALRDTLPVPTLMFLPTFGWIAAMLTLPFVIDRLVSPALGGVAGTLVLPVTFAAAEFLRSRVPGASSWWSIAYSQYGFLPLMQVAAVVGIWGITFLVVWLASTVEFAWTRQFRWTEIRGPVLTCGLTVVIALVGGYFRVIAAPTDRPSMRIATLNRPVDLFLPGEMTKITEGRVSAQERPAIDAKLSRLHDWFLDGSRREARAGARLIAWPEQNLLIFAADEAAFLDRARRIASDEHVYLAMGLGTIHVGALRPFENKVILIDPAGRVAISHLKNRPVMGWEAGIMQPGDDGIPVVDTAAGRMATAICFEGDFPEFVRQAGENRADLLILPVNDWRSIKTLHLQMHVFRAIENGVPLVRAAASGLSAAIDPWGRVLSVSDFFAAGDRTMTAQVPIGRMPTLYARIGDLFAWMCVSGTIVMLAAVLIAAAGGAAKRVITRQAAAAVAAKSATPMPSTNTVGAPPH
jgi:apolipoprotein N-acyltransferase